MICDSTRRRVLLAEPNRKAQPQIRNALLSNDFIVDTADSSADAIEMIRSEPPGKYDSLLTSNHLADISAANLFAAIQKDPEPPAFVMILDLGYYDRTHSVVVLCKRWGFDTQNIVYCSNFESSIQELVQHIKRVPDPLSVIGIEF